MHVHRKVHLRIYLSAEGEHGEKKINFWEGPTRVSEWKEEQVRRTKDCPSGTYREIYCFI